MQRLYLHTCYIYTVFAQRRKMPLKKTKVTSHRPQKDFTPDFILFLKVSPHDPRRNRISATCIQCKSKNVDQLLIGLNSHFVTSPKSLRQYICQSSILPTVKLLHWKLKLNSNLNWAIYPFLPESQVLQIGGAIVHPICSIKLQTTTEQPGDLLPMVPGTPAFLSASAVMHRNINTGAEQHQH